MLNISLEQHEKFNKVCHALSTKLRTDILSLLLDSSKSCLELSKLLNYPLSTISSNVKVLEEAGLVITKLLPAKNGSKKMCSLVYTDIVLNIESKNKESRADQVYETEVLIGNYMDFKVEPTCGYVLNDNSKIVIDNPKAFYDINRVNAGLIWFRQGYVEYKVPYDCYEDWAPKSLEISFELCSEAPGYHLDWKSDITVWINGVELGTYTSPGDYGGRKGLNTPDFWDITGTQYGILTKWKINQDETRINDFPVSNVNIHDINLSHKAYFTLRIGIKEDSNYIGGINLFGKCFGDYAQDIIVKIF